MVNPNDTLHFSDFHKETEAVQLVDFEKELVPTSQKAARPQRLDVGCQRWRQNANVLVAGGGRPNFLLTNGVPHQLLFGTALFAFLHFLQLLFPVHVPDEGRDY